MKQLSKLLCFAFLLIFHSVDAQQSFDMKLDSLNILKQFGKISEQNFLKYSKLYNDSSSSEFDDNVKMEAQQFDSLKRLVAEAKIDSEYLTICMEESQLRSELNYLALKKRRIIITERLKAEQKKK